jgi:hypothetical protein
MQLIQPWMRIVLSHNKHRTVGMGGWAILRVTKTRNQQTKTPTLLQTKKDGPPSRAKAEIHSQLQPREQRRTTEFRTELVKRNHATVKLVNRGEHGDGKGRLRHPLW